MRFGKSLDFTLTLRKLALPEENATDSSSLPFHFVLLEEYLSKWEQGILGPLYLKDWHFKKDLKNAVIYETPKIFEDDWLNEWWDR